MALNHLCIYLQASPVVKLTGTDGHRSRIGSLAILRQFRQSKYGCCRWSNVRGAVFQREFQRKCKYRNGIVSYLK